MRAFAVALKICCCFALNSGQAFDIYEPAEVKLTVVDQDGQPMPGVEVKSGEQRQTTNERGELLHITRRPQWTTNDDWSGVGWSVWFLVRSDLQYGIQVVYCFPGARLESRLTVTPYQETRIRLVGPGKEPLRDFLFGYSYKPPEAWGCTGSAISDENGECVLRLSRQVSAAGIHVGSATRRVELTGGVVTCEFADGELPRTKPSRSLRLRLLQTDGRPASGWLVAGDFTRSEGPGNGCSPGPSVVYSYQTHKFARSDEEGVVTIPVSGRFIGLRAPDGQEFLFPVAPKTWPEGERRVTLSSPAIRRIQKGQLVQTEGKAVPDYRLRLWGTRAYGHYFRLGFWEHWKGRAGDARAADLKTMASQEGWVTDAEGRYAIPLYYGAMPWVGSIHISDNAAGMDCVVEREIVRKPAPPPKLKRVFLKVVDAGQRVTVSDLTCWYREAGKKPSDYRNHARCDTRGAHLFLRPEDAELTLWVSSPGFDEWETTVSIPGNEDREFVLERPASAKGLPLRGQVYDANKRAVRSAFVELLLAPDPARGQTEYADLKMHAETDADGHFSFDMAPTQCVLKIDGLKDGPLPGWTPLLPVTREQRDIRVQLHDGGVVKVEAPQGLPDGAFLYLTRSTYVKHEPRLPDLKYDRQAEAWTAMHVPPGLHQLRVQKDMQGNSIQSVEVKEGLESLVDLTRYHSVELVVASAEAKGDRLAKRVDEVSVKRSMVDFWQEVNVTMGGKQYPGAIVTVYAPGTDADGRIVLRDLADDTGKVFFPGREGASFVVVARAPGRGVGWQTVTTTPDRSISIEMNDVRTLTVEAVADEEGIWGGSFWREVQIKDVSPAEQTALGIALDLGYWCPPEAGRGSGVPVRWDQEDDAEPDQRFNDEKAHWKLTTQSVHRSVAMDLPVGRTYILGAGPQKREIVLSKDCPAELVVRWPEKQ